jgi:excisionase family DNA binding protein
MTEDRLLTVPEVAEQMRASEETVRRWLRSGRLHGFQPGGTRLGWRIAESEVQRFRRELSVDARRDAAEHQDALAEGRRRIRGEAAEDTDILDQPDELNEARRQLRGEI